MPDRSEALLELLRRCTVRFSGASQGTGFFVAPGWILTCAHVVEDMRDKAASIVIEWQGQPIEWEGKPDPPTILKYCAKPYPDLALLQVKLGNHPCVYLDGAIEVGDRLYSFGYTDQYPGGDSATFEYEGPTGTPPLLKFKEGQVRPGLSGSPLLNRRTRAVCGIVKRTRDRDTDLGGRAIPYATILAEFDELSALQQRFHRADPAWRDRMTPEQRALWKTEESPNPFYAESPEPLGRDKEIGPIRAKVLAGAHCLIVGPMGSGKSLMLKSIQHQTPSWLMCPPIQVQYIDVQGITSLMELQRRVVSQLGGSRANEWRAVVSNTRLRLLMLDNLGAMDPGPRGLAMRHWLRGLDGVAGTKLLMASNQRLEIVFHRDDPNSYSTLAGLDGSPIPLDPLPIEACRRIVELRLEGTGLDPASFSDLFQSPRQPRDLLHAAAVRYDALANARR